MQNKHKNVIVKAKINGKIVTIDLASDKKKSYSDLPKPIEYLGEGEYYSFDEVLATQKNKMHFWRFLKETEIPKKQIVGTTTFKVQKTDSEFIKTVGNLITDNEGKKFYYIPYWYEEIGEGLFTEHTFEKLPESLKEQIKKLRHGNDTL